MLKQMLRPYLYAVVYAISIFGCIFLSSTDAYAVTNQTTTLSPVLPEDDIPFTVEVTLADFQLPTGLHSYAFGIYKDKWVLFAGKLNGLHGFGTTDNNFPPDQQNTKVYVVDHQKKRVWTRDLLDPASGLTQEVVDTLSVSNPQFYQSGNTLYVSGGYGVITATGEFSTKDTLTALDLPGIIDWTLYKTDAQVSDYIRQTHDPVLKVTGGEMKQMGKHPTVLVFGQDYDGFYYSPTDGMYTQQVRRFIIHDDGKSLSISVKEAKPEIPNEDYRRRDLNVLPIIEHRHGKPRPALMAYSGVFTRGFGMFTVPVLIRPDGSSFMEDPTDASSFKQPMNCYFCPTLGLYSEKHRDMYTILFGGLSYVYYQDGQFYEDPEIPFINEITTIKRDKEGRQSQYLMNASYPLLISEQSNPGNVLRFGVGAIFFPKTPTECYDNGIIKFDTLKKGKIHIGYIVGGIQSTVPNTTSDSDTAGSPYIFKVYIKRK